MPRRRNGQRSLARSGEPSERTPNSDLEVPVPTRDEFFKLLGKAATTAPDEPSESGKGKRRTSRDR
jgi:hypothetical protein